MHNLLKQASEHPRQLTRADLVRLLAEAEPADLFAAAYAVKERNIGKRVALRGLIEFGNICQKDCFYCGIRRSNDQVQRYRLDADDVVRMAVWAWRQQYGSVVLQSGELESEENTALIETVLRRISAETGGELGVTLSLGEQNEETYRRWLEAGAHRYLLRIETSNPALYARLHPPDHRFERRLSCLQSLHRLGYQTGSGVMIGLPGQTLEDLADDVLFFGRTDLDMIGMGPFIPHHQTPMRQDHGLTTEARQHLLQLSLKMIAVTRLYLHDVNIAATTALQAIDDRGREQGLLAGANVIMPNVTDVQYRSNYQLYDHKPCLDENAAQCRTCLSGRIQSVGESISWGERGDPPHFHARNANPKNPAEPD